MFSINRQDLRLTSHEAQEGLSEKGRETMKEQREKQVSEEGRRDFLRKSAYAAYATPVITGLLVEKASAAKSWNSGKGEITRTGSAPANAPLGPDDGANAGWGKDEKETP